MEQHGGNGSIRKGHRCAKVTGVSPLTITAYKTYSPKAIVSALGHTLAETSKEIKRYYKMKSSPR